MYLASDSQAFSVKLQIMLTWSTCAFRVTHCEKSLGVVSAVVDLNKL